MKERLNNVLENYLCTLGLSQEELRLDLTWTKRVAKEIVVQAFEHFYPIITEEYGQEIEKYLLRNLPMTPDDKEAFVEEMFKNIKI